MSVNWAKTLIAIFITEYVMEGFPRHTIIVTLEKILKFLFGWKYIPSQEDEFKKNIHRM